MKKSGKRIAVILILIGVLLGPGGTANAATPVTETVLGIQGFEDVAHTHWAYQSVGEMAGRGIVEGYPDKTFKPEKSVTYGEFMKMASVILDGKDAGNSPGTAWAENYYGKLLEKGFYTSFDISEVKLNWTIPRGDMALIINGLLGEEITSDFEQVEKGIRDINSDTEHEFEIVKAYGLGILKGYPDGTFRPEGKLSRAEAAASLHRVIQRKAETDIFSFIKNMEEFRKEAWIETGNYRFITPAAAEMRIRVPWDGKLAAFDHTMMGFIYLVRDNKIIEYCRSIPADIFVTSVSHYNLEPVDYIICIPTKYGVQTHIIIMVNPFKKQV